MNSTNHPEVQKALVPPHSQTSASSNRSVEQLTMDHSVPFDFYSFMHTGYMTVAMESHADVWDVFPGACVTRYFDGTAELHASSQPAALMHLDSFEIAFQSSDPTCSVNEMTTSRSTRVNKYILFETPEREPNAYIARCRFRIVIPDTLFPWNGEQAHFRIRVCALFNTYNPDRPEAPILQRGPEKVHIFSLRLRTSSRGLPFGP